MQLVFVSNRYCTHTQSHQQLAFYGQHRQQRSQQPSSIYRGNTSKFTSNGRGFQAQKYREHNRIPTTADTQRRPPPLGEHRMTQTERDNFRNEKCQYCGTEGHIAKICW